MQQSSTSSGLRSNGFCGIVHQPVSYASKNIWKDLQADLEATDLDVAHAIAKLEREEEGDESGGDD